MSRFRGKDAIKSADHFHKVHDVLPVDQITVVDAGIWPNDFTYAMILGETSHIVEVAACHGVFVELVEIPGNPRTRTYEFAIGLQENSKCELRDGIDGNLLASHNEGLLHCTELRAFWFTWERGVIKMGTGYNVGSNMVIQYSDPNPLTVNAVGIGALEGVDALFEFKNYPGECNPGKYFIFSFLFKSYLCSLFRCNNNTNNFYFHNYPLIQYSYHYN